MNKLTVVILNTFITASLCSAVSCSKGFQASTTSGQTVSTPPQTSGSNPPPPSNPDPPSSSSLTTPPASATVFANLQQGPGWQSCDSTDCAGGSGTGTYWMAQNQTTPALGGSSMELYNSGVWANSLWWQKVGAQNNATNFLWDFYAQVDDASAKSAQAFEFDAFQFVAGFNYMFGSQCDVGVGVWDFWDELNGRWVHSSVPCKQFAPDVWHHIQLYVQRNNDSSHSYTFVALAVDGTKYSLNQTYSAKNNGWSDNAGVQYQLDVNATGSGFHEWIDQSTLTVW